MNESEGRNLFKNQKSATLLALAVMFFWGSLFPVIKLGYQAFEIDTGHVGSILLFAGVRFVICGIVLLIAAAKKNHGLQAPKREALAPILLIALTTYTLHYFCTYVGISHLESSKTVILKQIGTLFIVCFAFLFRKEDVFSWKKLLGGLLGFASILVINLKGNAVHFSLYDLLIIMASFSLVAGVVFSKNAYDHQDPLTVTAWAQLIGGLALLGMGVVGGGSFGRFGWDSAGVLTYMCFASCMGYALWNQLLKYQNMSRLNTIKFTETLFSAFCSWLLLGENIFHPTYLVSVALVCAGIAIGNGYIKIPGGKRK